MRAVTSTLFAALVASVANAQSSVTASPVGGAPAGSSGGNAGASPSGPGVAPSSAGAGQGSATPTSSAGGVPPSASSAAGISSTPGVGGATPSASTVPGGSAGVGAGNGTATGNSTIAGNSTAGNSSYPYLNGTAAVNYLLQSLNLSTGCQATVKSLTSNATAEGQCLHTGVVWAGKFNHTHIPPPPHSPLPRKA